MCESEDTVASELCAEEVRSELFMAGQGRSDVSASLVDGFRRAVFFSSYVAWRAPLVVIQVRLLVASPSRCALPSVLSTALQT